MYHSDDESTTSHTGVSQENSKSYRHQLAEHSIEPASVANLKLGTLVGGKYRLVDSIGEGGMGVVYKVEQIMLQQQMALKTLTGSEFSESSIKRFRSEAQLLAKLDHPGLVKVVDFGFIDDVKPFLVMDFVQGKTLSSILKKSGILPLDVALKLFVELSFALGYAHSKGVVHRDIKPSNIMLTTPGVDSENEHVKVLDFGIAKFVNGGPDGDALTRTGEVIGSPFYMSPEQCYGRPIDHRSDIYSMGCVMFEVLTGAPPFSGETSLTTMMMHQTATPLTLKEASMGCDYPQEIEKLVARMMEKEPERRFQSLFDVAQILIGLQKGETGTINIQSAARAPQREKTVSLSVRHLAFILYAVFALSIGLIAFYFYNQINTPPVAEDEENYNLKKPWLTSTGSFKTFHFPKKLSLGTINVSGSGIVREAIGDVTFRKDDNITFNAGPNFFAHPQFLRRFGPNDLFDLDLRSCGRSGAFDKVATQVRVSDDELVYADHLTGLKMLGMRDCSITDRGLAHLQHLPNLILLDVDRTDVTADGVSKMDCLHHLHCLRAGYLKDGWKVLKALKGSTQIDEICLTNTELKNEHLKYVKDIPNLRELNVSCNQGVNDDGMKYLIPARSLRRLNVTECPITPKAFPEFFKMSIIEAPSVTSRHWSPTDLAELQAHWPEAPAHHSRYR